MKKQLDHHFRRDLVKLGCLTAAILGTLALFVVTPSLSYPTLLSMVFSMLLAPWVTAFERRGYSRALSIALIFALLLGITILTGVWGVQSGISEWHSFRERAPEHFHRVITSLKAYELDLKSRYSILKSVEPTQAVLNWGQNTGQWFVVHGPAIMGELLTWLFIIPPLSFVLLNEGKVIRKRFFQLVPNRYFESFFSITYDITTAISDYLRAKLVEALLVGLMVTIGLALIKAPYSIVLGFVAGITNIIPYIGPIIGAVPGILIAAFDTRSTDITIPVILVYVIANLIDMIVIFPVVVAKLVKLHPLILIAVVMVGQHYYGLVGMLISIPLATALKVVLQEIYTAVYEQKPSTSEHEADLDTSDRAGPPFVNY